MSTPTTVPFPTDAGAVSVTRIAGEASTMCGIDTASQVWCWGGDPQGNLGNGAPITSSTTRTPVLVVDSTQTPIHAVDIQGSFETMCAITAAGAVLCWGTNADGELAQDAGVTDAGVAFSNVALPIPGLSMPGGHLAGGADGFYNVAAAPDGGIACWGNNGSSQCGNAASPVFTTALGTTFAEAGAALPPRTVSHGEQHVCILDQANQVLCTGSDSSGQTGPTGSNGYAAASVGPLADAGVTALSCGRFWTCVVDFTAHAFCFGSGSRFGFLGNGVVSAADGGSFASSTPQPVVVPDGGLLSSVAQVVAGGDQTCAILEGPCGAAGGGKVVCWGFGVSGNLGNGEAVTSASAVPVIAPE
jgi:alpha-tubulin suppressor-like RCC1 family protein